MSGSHHHIRLDPICLAAKQFIVEETIAQCELQGTMVLAEGVETKAELDCLLGLGIRYYQGYYFARPELERLITTAELSGML